MTAKKTETKATTDAKPAAEPNTKVATGKAKPKLDDKGRDQVAQDDAAARNATMEPVTGNEHRSQAEIASKG